MFCIHCGTQNPDAARFCNGCGKSPASGSALPIKKNETVRIWAVLLVLVCVLGGVWVLFGLLTLPDWMTYHAGNLDSPSPLLPRVPVRREVIPAAFVVPPAHWQWYPFTIPAGAVNGNLGGRFTASGGFGNDIQCVVTDVDGLSVVWALRV